MNLHHDRTRPIQILVSHMTPLVACGIAAAIAAHPDFQQSGCKLEEGMNGDGFGLLGAPDVVVTDNEHGLLLARHRTRPGNTRTLPDVRIFVISPANGERDIRMALEAGINGYASLEITVDEFVRGVHALVRGSRYVCPGIAQRLADSVTTATLTPREADVLTELARGSCNKTIAQDLHVAVGTVKAHIKSLMSKFDARTRTQVVSMAIARGLVRPGFNTDIAAGRDWRFSRERRSGVSLVA